MTFIQFSEVISIPNKNNFLKDYRVYMTYFSVIFLVVTTGTTNGWASPMVAKLKGTEDNPLGRVITVDESGWLASIPILGNILGSLICGALGPFIGRKTTLTIMGIPCVIFCFMMAFTKNIWFYLLARFLTGISGGAMFTVIPMYIGEIAKPEMRGRLFVYILVASNLGSLITFSTAPFVPFFWYHICLSILPIIFLILFPIFALESPYYIIRTNTESAEKTLKQLREKDDVSVEMNRMKMDLQKASGMGVIEVFRTRATRKAFLIALGLGLLLMLSGNATVMSYAQFIFEESGSSWSSAADTIILSVVQLFSAILSTTVTDKLGRKPLLAISFGIMCLSEVTLGLYLVLEDVINMGSSMKQLPLISLIVFVITSSFVGIIPSLSGELFCLRAKHIALSTIPIFTGITGFLTTYLFEKVENGIGLGPTFLIFAGFAAISVIFVLTVVVETKGKSLEQIQDKLEGSKKKRCVGNVLSPDS